MSLILTMVLLVGISALKSTFPDNIFNLNSDTLTLFHVPVFSDLDKNDLGIAKITFADSLTKVSLKKIVIHFSKQSSFKSLSSVSVDYSGKGNETAENKTFGSSQSLSAELKIFGQISLARGTHIFHLNAGGKKDADPEYGFEITGLDFFFDNADPVKIKPDSPYKYHICKILRAKGQDNCDTYRIPGLATTKKGTLIAVYDNRYRNSGDLQGDIDIGMSRSTTGGKTWEQMKVIMDMDEWGGRPQAENGIGDPCVLVDNVTNTIWVAALWFHGNPGKSAWGSSKPGLTPPETGQFMLVKSEDDGVTWSKPESITPQVKIPGWYLIFQGPGKGITLKDGTLIFPAQFKDEQQVPHSTIIYSRDHGKTWIAGTGAKSNTTEAQVVQLSDGSLMLNMRDNRNGKEKGESNGRAVAVTRDLGKTWQTHSSSNSALPEPVCQASLITSDIVIKGKPQKVLFFSNPDNTSSRTNMTIKASLDQGVTWPLKYQLELNSALGYGYSCMTMVDSKTIGILYEGIKELYFQKISVKNIIRDLK